MKLPLLLLCLSLLACKKDKNEEVMPNYSMNGSNTFAAYVNGELWLPKGRPSTFQKNFDITYDPAYKGGTLNIAAYRKISDNPSEYEHVIIAMAQADHEGVYTFDNPEISGVRFYNQECEYDKSPEVYREGQLEITKLDLQNGIIAGKFEFTLTKPGCDTIRVTEGRFDKKIF
ncbi:hypothetical protein CLV24_12175 [Pontibacter ummariensis]|uniref:Lipoprotein n=2 Tax=Pontibacter ummariensis TaxID=1610492 RepID=A0A239JEI2_9BACT|nr:hypothetical protein CLV24_12175 [Pontibacter ummariensis]SNT04219.1 hypothetical protein SAMN06296052_12175 [Pontibacter ummariensis]